MNVLLYIWQLPQNLLGLVLRLFYKAENTLDYKGTTVRINRSFPGGISLGDTVFLSEYPHNKASWADVKHEYGHSIQSRWLGWLYLIVIGLPSLCGNIFDRLFDMGSQWYYDQPWEKWADWLGGVDRKQL